MTGNENDISSPDYAYAQEAETDELWIAPNNADLPQDEEYITVFREVRAMLVGYFISGRLYRSTTEFAGCLKDVHRFIANSGVYTRLGTRSYRLEERHYGELDNRYGRFSNIRIQESRDIIPIARKFNDPYGATDRLEKGRPNSEDMYTFHLPGISEDNLPYDIVRYDGEGKIKELYKDREHYPEGGYEYMYPDVAGVWEYLDQMRQLGSSIETIIQSRKGSKEEILRCIAKQYQYGVCARPFVQINNSILMQLVNMQIKILGYRGITHGLMDIAAQRMQPDTFADYFITRMQGEKL